MCNAGNKIMICQLQNAKSSKVLQSLCTAKSKNKSDTITYTFSRNHCFNSSFKSRFQEAFLVNIIYTKNTQYALKPLLPCGNKRSHILKQAYSF